MSKQIELYFIQLRRWGLENESVFINIEHISGLVASDNGEGPTTVNLLGDSNVGVKESPAEIFDLIRKQFS